MKLITVVVAPHALDDVRRGLERHAVLGMTIGEVHARAPRLRVETVVHDEVAERVVRQLVGDLAPGADDDARLTVRPVDLVLRVRTGELGADAV